MHLSLLIYSAMLKFFQAGQVHLSFLIYSAMLKFFQAGQVYLSFLIYSAMLKKFQADQLHLSFLIYSAIVKFFQAGQVHLLVRHASEASFTGVPGVHCLYGRRHGHPWCGLLPPRPHRHLYKC